MGAPTVSIIVESADAIELWFLKDGKGGPEEYVADFKNKQMPQQVFNSWPQGETRDIYTASFTAAELETFVEGSPAPSGYSEPSQGQGYWLKWIPQATVKVSFEDGSVKDKTANGEAWWNFGWVASQITSWAIEVSSDEFY